MYRLDREQFVASRFWGLWTLLGFQAGYVNAFGFLACGRYVSHVTGFGTQIGTTFATTGFVHVIELLGFPLSFIGGAFLNSYHTIARLERGLKPRFKIMTLALPVGFTVVLIGGVSGIFGAFDAQAALAHEVFLLYVLTFLCGLQNGCFATLTRGQIRTTHLTGISTDIGTDIARLWYGRLKDDEHSLTYNMNFCRVLTFAGFTTGSIASVLVSRYFEYSAMAVPVVSSLVVYFSVGRVQKFLDLKYKSRLVPVPLKDRPIRLGVNTNAEI